MTDINKEVKMEQWLISQLIAKIKKKDISKPKYQRKRKWDKLPKKENTPNIKRFYKLLI